MRHFSLPFTIPLGRRGRIAARYAAFAVFALTVFVFALQIAFPYERLKDRLVDAMAASYDVQISDVERGIIPGRVYFNNVTLRTRITKPDEVVTPLFIRRLKIDAGLLALLRRSASVDFDAAIGDAKNGVGHIAGNITLPKFGQAGIAIDLEGKSLPGAGLPLRSLVGLPILGTIDFAFKLDLPTTSSKAGRTSFDWRKASGFVDLACRAHCTVGDGKTKLRPLLQDRTNQAMVGDGIDFGKLELDSLVAHGVFMPATGDPDGHSSSSKPGKFELQKFELKSPDGELHVEYAMTMAQDFGDSMVAGCLRYKANDHLLQKEETKRTYAAISTIGAELRGDGLFHIRLTDRFKDMKRLNQECGPNAKPAGNGEDYRVHSGIGTRPNLTAPTEDAPRPPVRPNVGNAMPPPPAPLPTEPESPAMPAAPPPGSGTPQPAAGPQAPMQPPGAPGSAWVQGSGAVPPPVAAPQGAGAAQGSAGMPGAGGAQGTGGMAPGLGSAQGSGTVPGSPGAPVPGAMQGQAGSQSPGGIQGSSSGDIGVGAPRDHR